MTLKRLLLVYSCILLGSVSAQTTTAFRVNYDQALFDLPGNAVEALAPNNYLFAGTNLNFLPIYGTVTQIDDAGNFVWSKRYYDGSLGFQLNDIKKDVAGNEYYLCGGSESNAAVFMRIDAAGNVVASTKFSISQADGAYFNRVIKTSDGGYLAVGYVTGHDPDGAGPEIDFAPINYIDANGDPQTEVIGSPLMVKMDANGNHLWHKVTRYYNNAAKDPTLHRIYNDASFNDVVEVSDGYIAVGSYDVNQHNSNTNSDGDDATANDALVFKTNTIGTIVYHKQYDALNYSATQTSKYLSAINKTSTGVPIAAGSADNGKEWIIKFVAAGGWSSTYSRLFTYSTFFGTPDPVEVSQIYEVAGSTDLVTMGMYIKPLSFIFSNSLHRINAAASANVWAKYYTFSMATILPRGSQTSDNGFIMSSTVMGGANFDYHVIKTDPTGDTPLTGCAPVTFTPAAAAGTTTTVDPNYNFWSGTVGPTALAVLVTAITPTTTVQCQIIVTPCTPPSAATTVTATPATICAGATSTITATGPSSNVTYNVFTAATGGTNLGAAPLVVTPATTTTYYVETSDNTNPTCVSVTRTAVTVTVNPAPTAPVIGTITQPTCSVATGSVALSGLPAVGSWTVTASPGGTTITGSGTTATFSGLTAGTSYTFTVTNVSGCTSVSSANAVLIAAPTTPTAPIVGTITQPTCSVSTGSVALSGLPASGSWTVTASPGGTTTTGSGTTTTFSGLTAGATYTFTVTNAAGCTSTASTGALINAAPVSASAPVIGTITQPTCSLSTGSVALSGLPASGSWTITTTPGGTTTVGSGTTTTISGLTAGTTYTFTVTNVSGCTSVSSANAVLNTAPTTPTAPIVGTITQPTCSVATGSVDFSGLPASGTWTLTASPGGTTSTGTGTTGTFSGLTAGTSYTFTVTNAAGCISTASTSAAINAAPVTPTAPIVGTITQPTCAVSTGSVALSGLPASGSWTVTASPGGTTITGSGTTANFTGLTAGTTYTFTVTNSAACTSVASTNAIINTVPGAPTAPVIGTITQPTCSLSTGSVALSGLPASGSWTITATPGGTTTVGSGTTTTISGLTAGTTYTFTVTNDLGCTSVSSANAVLNTAPTTPTAPIVGTITQPTCSVATGSADFSGLPASGTWTLTASPGGTTSTGTGTTGTFSGLTAGTSYTFTVTNAAGCISTTSTSAAINAAPVTPTAPIIGTITQPTCAVSTGSVALSGLPASGSWTVTASPGGATITGTGTTANFTGLVAGTTYTFTVTNSATCTSVASTNAAINTVPGAPTAPVIGTITQPTCSLSTGSVALSGLPASGTWTVTVSPGGTTTTGTGTTTTVSGLTAGTTYTFTVTNDLGCTSSASTNAALNAAPTTPTAPIVGTITQPTCSVATGSVDFSGLPASGTWTLTASPGGTTSTGTGTTGTFAGLTAGTSYTFTVTNAAGCISTASTSAAINAAPVTPTTPIVGTITQPTCAVSTGSVALSGLPASGSWTVTASPGGATITGTGTTANFNGLVAGTTYTFTVTNSATCTSVASTNAAINTVPGAPTAPVIGTITQPTCSLSTGSVALSGLPASGTWTVTVTPGGTTTTGTGTTTTVSGLTAGTTYTFTVTNDLGCTSPVSTNAVLNAAPTTPTAPIVGTITQPTCSVATGSVDFSGLPASGTWTLTASPGGTTSTGTGTTGTFAGLTAGTSYTFTVTNAAGCISTASTSAAINTVPVTPSAPIVGTITQPTCTSPTGTVALSGLPSSGSWTITASPGGTTISGSGTTANFTGLTAGTTYTFTVTNSATCTSVSSTNAVINTVPGAPTAPTAGTVTQPTCSVPTGTIEVGAPLGANYTYSIDGITFQASTTFSSLNPGSYTITVTDLTSGCSSTSASTVTINAIAGAPAASLVSSTPVTCFGDTDGALTISISGGQSPYTYVWTPNVGVGPSLTNLAAGNYSVVVTDDLGCSSTANFTVGTPNNLAVNGDPTNVLCGISDGTITTAVTGGTGPFTYAWTPNGEVTDGLTGLAAGTYSTIVTDDNGCTATESFTIGTTGSLPVVIDPDYALIDAGTSIQLTASGGDSYTWTPTNGLSCTTCPDPIASPSTSTVYYVTATDANGCTGGDTVLVEIKSACGELFVPNIFSPNGTGPDKNNTLCVFGTPACVVELAFAIYNRWGEKVFETTDITVCWDGTYKTKPMNSGIYVYKLNAVLSNGDIIEQSGNITLVR